LLYSFLQWFPGVPIFFVISGFLISRSFENQPVIGDYARKRFLRIYPALWACFLSTIVMVAVLAPTTLTTANRKELVAWMAAHVSFFQFYNPSFLRDFGIGVVNGSLWTIPVELQFYAAVPVVYFLSGGPRRLTNSKLLVLITIFLVVNQVALSFRSAHPDELWCKLLMASMFPYFWLFLLGVIAQRNWRHLQGLFQDKFLVWMILYAVGNQILGGAGFTVGTNHPTPILAFVLAGLTLSAAYSYRGFAEKVLRGHDISYGLYIYHMPVINAFVELRFTASMLYALVAFQLTLVLAVLSWGLIESPSLRGKSCKSPHSSRETTVSKTK